MNTTPVYGANLTKLNKAACKIASGNKLNEKLLVIPLAVRMCGLSTSRNGTDQLPL